MSAEVRPQKGFEVRLVSKHMRTYMHGDMVRGSLPITAAGDLSPFRPHFVLFGLIYFLPGGARAATQDRKGLYVLECQAIIPSITVGQQLLRSSIYFTRPPREKKTFRTKLET